MDSSILVSYNQNTQKPDTSNFNLISNCMKIICVFMFRHLNGLCDISMDNYIQEHE